FLLLTRALSPDSSLLDSTTVILPDSVIAGNTTVDIDSINPNEASPSRFGSLNAVCSPPRPWAFWRSANNGAVPYFILAYTHTTPPDSVAGSITITQFANV